MSDSASAPTHGSHPSNRGLMDQDSSASKSPALEDSGSSRLRAATASLHQQVERTLGLPGSIRTLDDYTKWLKRFFGLYQPLERRLRECSEWREWNIEIEDMGQSKALSSDLTAILGDVKAVELAPDGMVPKVEIFSRALGALYVLEGSKLGGQFILRDLSSRLGAEIAGRDAFFTGHGGQTASRWIKFRSSLDRFAAQRPQEFPELVEGAQATFAAVQIWMSPLNELEAT